MGLLLGSAIALLWRLLLRLKGTMVLACRTRIAVAALLIPLPLIVGGSTGAAASTSLVLVVATATSAATTPGLFVRWLSKESGIVLELEVLECVLGRVPTSCLLQQSALWWKHRGLKKRLLVSLSIPWGGRNDSMSRTGWKTSLSCYTVAQCQQNRSRVCDNLRRIWFEALLPRRPEPR